MYKSILFFLALLPLFCQAQLTVSGKIINAADKQPVAKASIFLSNTTVGTTSADNGNYSMVNVKPGQYTLVVSAVGYETYNYNLAANANVTALNIELKPTSIELKDVVIKPDKEWEQNYAAFKNELFGPSPAAQECKILNPEMLDLTYDKVHNRLLAKSYDYLEIENRALGYKLHYKLEDFERDYRDNSYYHQWSVLFEDLKGSKSQQRRWNKNRINAYLGSSEHYYRSVLNHQTEKEGFKTLRLIRKDNPKRPTDSLIKAKMHHFMLVQSAHKVHGKIVANDSLTYWANQSAIPKIVQYLITTPQHTDSLLHRTDVTGLYALSFKDCLYVLYTKKHNTTTMSNLPMNAPDNLTSIVTLTDPYLFFDTNGVVANLHGFVYEGDWAARRVADLLPVDYEPPVKKP
ncbi:carboxypeptidase-like regulatory domain-containing protein [Mucilaginibacter robiniae]|uniref:Carboxypeptidase-like regulatory domain-containing protein n=1 Tax=Mucilaginibacter robiniae TaxID=2728022 RepID=A0A7L5DVK6_9SPHI|nr:carboxypeptidase-like regulatory domain-containing protein [Mucilaginibacter robiniae]QJD95135.1 carboxypeptidase-like regulatory domain-containing protein [Mucilaginibacter robiniae]